MIRLVRLASYLSLSLLIPCYPLLSANAQSVDLLKDINTAPQNIKILQSCSTALGNFLIANDFSHGPELWISDGRGAGTHLVKEIVPGEEGIDVNEYDRLPCNEVNGEFWFFVGNDLWRSNGTSDGTTLVTSFPDASPYTYRTKGRVYPGVGGVYVGFSADDDAMGRKLVFLSSAGVKTEIANRLVKEESPSGDSIYFVSANTLGELRAYHIEIGELSATFLGALGSHTVEDSLKIIATPSGAFLDLTTFSDDGSTQEVWLANPQTVARLVDGVLPDSGEISMVGRAGSRVVMKISYGSSDASVIATDGTPAGTETVLTVSQGSIANAEGTSNGTYLFLDLLESNGDHKILKTDGTAAGSKLISPSSSRPKDFGFDDHGSGIIAEGGHLYFVSRNQNNQLALYGVSEDVEYELSVFEISPYSVSWHHLFPFHGGALLSYRKQDANGSLVTNGTPEGTHLLDASVPGVTLSSDPTIVGVVNGKAIVAATSSSGSFGLWATGGIANDVVLLGEFAGDVGYFSSNSGTKFSGPAGEFLLVGNTSRIFRTNGTVAGTFEIVNSQFGAGNPYSNCSFSPVLVGNKVIFSREGLTTGCDLWRTDGTIAGTMPVRTLENYQYDRVLASTSRFSDEQVMNNTLFFIGCDASDACGLWKTDGTEAGTQSVDSRQVAKVLWDHFSMIHLGAKLFYRGCSLEAGGSTSCELWSTDGSAGGSAQFSAVNNHGDADVRILEAHNGRIYFSADDGSHGNQLWITDGTSDGTRMLKEISNQDPDVPLNFYGFTSAGSKAFFIVNSLTGDDFNPRQTFELYASDGSAAGTVRLLEFDDLNFDGCGIASATEHNGALFISSICDGVIRSDGTLAGTRLIKGGFGYGEIGFIGDNIYFSGPISAGDNFLGNELLTATGPSFDTVRLAADINPGSASAFRGLSGDSAAPNAPFLALNNRLIFSALSARTGVELYSVSEADLCPDDPSKSAPGICGCGIADTDSDGDGKSDCVDACPVDPAKSNAGMCGCGVADTDSDGDGLPDCLDQCPNDMAKTVAGVCGCGVADTDTDGDGTPNCLDRCPLDSAKLQPGVCGCGAVDIDANGNNVMDCLDPRVTTFVMKKPKLTPLVNKTVRIEVTALTGVKYEFRYSVLDPKKKKGTPAIKKVRSALPQLVVKGIKDGLTLSVSYLAVLPGRIEQSSPPSATVKLKIKYPKKKGK